LGAEICSGGSGLIGAYCKQFHVAAISLQRSQRRGYLWRIAMINDHQIVDPRLGQSAAHTKIELGKSRLPHIAYDDDGRNTRRKRRC
jgi:hypothetical protein